MKRKGLIYTWSLLQYGFIVDGKEIFFLHGSEILEGAEKATVGAKVEFEVGPPFPGKKYPKALKVVVGGTN